MNILIVEDDENVRRFLRLCLSAQGYAVEEAANGQEGLARARERRPDLIISEGLMPVMDGFQLLKALKADPGLSSIPFIFLSAVFTGQRELDLAYSLGADAFLVKPQKPEAILDAVRSAADRQAAQRVRPAAADEDPELAREYSRIVATTLEEKVRQLETATAELERTQEELRESETIYRGLFEHSPQPMWVYNLETLAFLAVNDAAIIAYGFSREEFLSMTIKDIRPPQDVPLLLDHLAGMREGFGDAGTWKHRRKDGAVIDVEITSHTLPFLGRQAKLVLANDVTERTRMEKSIRAASEEWRSTFDAMSDAIALLDRDGRILRCNKAMATFVNTQYSEIIGRPCWEVIQGTTGPVVACPYTIMKESRKRETLVAQMGDRWFDVAADPFFDSEGNLLGAVHIMADITERKLADEVLKRRESQLAESQRIAGIGSWERDLATNAVVWSKELFRIFGLDPERVAPSFEILMGLIVPEDRELQQKSVQEAIRENKPYNTDFRIMKPEGTTALIHSQGEVICDEAGKPVLLRGTAQDITERRQMEDALKAAVARAEDEKARSDSIIAAIGDGISIQDRNFRILYENEAQKKMVGDHVGELCHQAYEKKEARCEGCGVAQVFKDGGTHIVERSAPTDKGLVHVEITASPLRDAKRNVIAGIEVVHNITERKKAEDLLREQKRFTENMIMGSAIATFVLDADHRVLIWNRSCEILTGISGAEMVGSSNQWKPFYGHERPVLADLVLGREPEKLALLYSNVTVSELLPDGLHAEDWFKKLNGKDRYVVFDAAPIRDNSGKIIAAVETLQDITERKTLENQLYRSKQDWEDTFNSITDMVTVHDSDYNIILANKAAEKILNLPMLENMKDRKCFAYYHGTDHAPEGCPSCSCLQTGVSTLFEIFEPHLNMFIEIRAIPRFDSNNKLIGLIHVVRDITERKQLEEQIKIHTEHLETVVQERTRALEDTNIELQAVNRELVLRREEAEAASRSKTDFLANMSHELRTPLNAIMGFSEIMLMDMAGPVTARQREFLNDISKSGNHLLSLINDVLDLSKVEAGKMELEPEPVIIEDLIAGSLMMFKEKTLKHAIKVETFIGPAVADITADRRKLKQVLMNLISNALKFTPDGGSVTVAARLIEGEKVGSWEDEKKPTGFLPSDTALVEISVADTGVGIPREQQKKLFQPFQQIDSSLSRKHAGTGLGLSLCRRFVELHGGRIWVESEPGKGSTFSFAIPVRRP